MTFLGHLGIEISKSKKFPVKTPETENFGITTNRGYRTLRDCGEPRPGHSNRFDAVPRHLVDTLPVLLFSPHSPMAVRVRPTPPLIERRGRSLTGQRSPFTHGRPHASESSPMGPSGGLRWQKPSARASGSGRAPARLVAGVSTTLVCWMEPLPAPPGAGARRAYRRPQLAVMVGATGGRGGGRRVCMSEIRG